MNTATSAAATTETTAAVNGNRPPYLVFSVRDRGADKKASWTEIGVGFENRDGSLNIVLNALPLDGRLCVRINEPRAHNE